MAIMATELASMLAVDRCIVYVLEKYEISRESGGW
jgi:hypothetical protein